MIANIFHSEIIQDNQLSDAVPLIPKIKVAGFFPWENMTEESKVVSKDFHIDFSLAGSTAFRQSESFLLTSMDLLWFL